MSKKVILEDGRILSGELVEFEEKSEVDELLEKSDELLNLAEEEEEEE